MLLGFWLPSPASSFGPVYTDVVPEGVLAETRRHICGASCAKGCKLGRLGLWTEAFTHKTLTKKRDVPLTSFCARTEAFDHLLGAPDMLCMGRVCLYLLKLKLYWFIGCQGRPRPKGCSRYQVMLGMWQKGRRFWYFVVALQLLVWLVCHVLFLEVSFRLW